MKYELWVVNRIHRDHYKIIERSSVLNIIDILIKFKKLGGIINDNNGATYIDAEHQIDLVTYDTDGYMADRCSNVLDNINLE